MRKNKIREMWTNESNGTTAEAPELYYALQGRTIFIYEQFVALKLEVILKFPNTLMLI